MNEQVMYELVLTFHSWMRWPVRVLAVVAIARALRIPRIVISPSTAS